MTAPTIVTSASTDIQVAAAYDDNAGYAANGGSVAMAHAFRVACLILERREASNMAKGANSLGYDRRMLLEEAKTAWQWILDHQGSSDNDRGGPLATRVDFGTFR